ncbi:MAG: hypothetical protein ACJA08_003001 [Cyclobacteriaceae bacterium]|jgi:hypothetical protein
MIDTKHLKAYLFTVAILIAFCLLASCEDVVKEIEDILVSNVTVEGAYITDGGSSQMSVIILPENASDQSVEWGVSNEAIASIDNAGNLTAVSNGNLTVTAMALDGSGVIGKKLIAVDGVYEPPVLVSSISISGGDIMEGKSQKYTVGILPVNANDKKVIWTVSDKEYAKIDSAGYLTPLKNGNIVIKASANDQSGVEAVLPINISGVNENVTGIIVATSKELLDALAIVKPGEFIYVREGAYIFGSTLRLSTNGQINNLISLMGYPGEKRPVFDFSSMSESSGNRGVALSGDYWHIKGIEIYKAGDNGLNISSSNNLIEYCAFHENADTGLQIGGGGANNTVINSDSYYNADSSLENADGFAAKLDCGSGNIFIGCRAWNNLDDGWDGYLRGADNVSTTYENCWAIRNGFLKNGSVGAGDGNGFKTGGSDTKDLKHNATFSNCIAAGNVYDGFDHNSNRGSIIIHNSSAHSNGRNFNFSSSNIAASLTIKNSVTLAGNRGDQLSATATDITNNSWQGGISATSADFENLVIDQLLGERKSDGSLPDIRYMHLVTGSDLIDAGIDIGLHFSGAAPDLGPFEYD